MSDLYPNGFALVIGGSGGVAQLFAKELVANNIPVLLTYNSNRERAEQLVEELAGATPTCPVNRSPCKTFRLSTARLMSASPSMGDCTPCSSPRVMTFRSHPFQT